MPCTTSKLKITTCEMHTCGTPLRIVEDGLPNIPGRNILEKLSNLEKKYDYIRKFLVHEPHGHHEVAVLRVEPDHPEADVAAIFAEKEGYVTMCGEATISFGRYCVDNGLVKVTEPETLIKMQFPCGLVPVYVSYENGQSGITRFRSVPSFVFALDVDISYNGMGHIKVDIAFGGAFYVIVSATSLGVNLDSKEGLKDAAAAGHALTEAVKRTVKLDHPESSDLAILNGTLVTDTSELSTKNLVRQLPVFRESEGRGPCGSGTSAHVALLHAKGLLKFGEHAQFQSAMTGLALKAKPVETISCGKFDAITVEVSGKGHYTGRNVLIAEDDDALKNGFTGI